MTAVLRELRSRFWALAALAVAVSVTAGLAALFVTAWGAGLPQGARADLLGSAADAVSISRSAGSAVEIAAGTRSVQAAVARVAVPGTWHLETVGISDVFDLGGAGGSGDGTVRQTYAVSSDAVRPNAVLTSGAWPGFAPGGAIGAALPVSALAALDLRIGSRLTLSDAITHTVVDFVVTGAFRYTTGDPAALAWNQIGASGVEPDGPSTYLGPLVADPAAFAGAALATAGACWVLTPTGADLAPDTLAAQAGALKDSAELAPQDGFTVSSSLPALVAGISARMDAGRAQLLAGAILLGMLAGAALAVSVGSLVARGGMQAALLYSRGAPRRTNVSLYAADIAVVLLSGVLGVLIEGTWWRDDPSVSGGSGAGQGGGAGFGAHTGGFVAPFSAWASGLAVVLVAALSLCVRAARVVEPAALATASGRQGSKVAIVRAGGDLALIVLAGVAVWQAGQIGLSARTADGGGVSPVLIVACAPALAVAAGAALCGRLVTGAARLFEYVAGRARSAPVRLATWELARTPLRYFVPALLCVAAVAGGASLSAQHASWLRSAHDQAAFSNGAQVAVALRQTLPLGEAASVASAPGVLSATPVTQIDIGDGTLVALDAQSAATTVALRPDLADEPTTRLWAGLRPSGLGADGVPVPGRPVALGLTGVLTGSGVSASAGAPVQVSMSVQDASGLTYSIPVGRLAPDAAPHSLSALIAPGAGADYPLRVTGITLQFAATTSATAVESGYRFTVSGLTERSSAGAVTPFAGAASIAAWSRRALSPGTVSIMPPAASGLLIPALATQSYLAENGEHVGSTDHVTIDGLSLGVRITASVTAFPALPAGDPNALIVDLSTLSDAVDAGGGQLWPTFTWWLHTADGQAPATLPAGAVVTTTDAVQAALTADPLAAIPQRVLGIAAPALIALAVLGLLISLLSASRAATQRDVVLSALGTTRPQLAALACLVYACVVVPAALFGTGLGFLLARVFTPVLVLGADGSPPQPSAAVLLDAPWSAAAVLAVVLATEAAALAVCLVRTGRLSSLGPGR